MNLNELGIQLRNHRCFGNDWQGFEEIQPINVIIGRNNSGKSSLLDLVDGAVLFDPRSNHSVEGLQPKEIQFTKDLSPEDFRDNTNLALEYSACTTGKLSWAVDLTQSREFKITNIVGGNIRSIIESELTQRTTNPEPLFLDLLKDPLSKNRFRRITSERDITPEHDSIESTVAPNGGQVQLSV